MQRMPKICAEVAVGSFLPESFDVILANGTNFPIKVWYPQKPLSCEKCMVFGHKTCADAVGAGKDHPKNKVWVVKNVVKPVSAALDGAAVVVVPSK